MTTAEALAVVREAMEGEWFSEEVDAALALIEQRVGEWERMEERWHSVESKVLMHDDALARAEKAEAERDNATAALERMRLELVRVDGMVSRYSQSADAVSEDRARWMERYAELEAALREAEQLMHDAQSAEAWHVLQRALRGGE